MTFLRITTTLLATAMFIPTAFAAGAHLSGDAAASLVDALTHAGSQTTAAEPAHFQVRADAIHCTISSSTGGNPTCTITVGGTDHQTTADDAYGTWIALSKVNGVQGGAHSGSISVASNAVVCDIYVERLGDNGQMPAMSCDL